MSPQSLLEAHEQPQLHTEPFSSLGQGQGTVNECQGPAMKETAEVRLSLKRHNY